jgi:hypothetical protein
LPQVGSPGTLLVVHRRAAVPETAGTVGDAVDAPEETQHVEVVDDGRVVASADVAATGTAAVAALHVEPGHLPPGTRTQLVDAVLDVPEVAGADRLTTAGPAGDVEVAQRVRERLDDVEARSAGATTFHDGTVPHT